MGTIERIRITQGHPGSMASLIEAEVIASCGCDMRRRHDPFR
jgi:hypothetical protein